MIIFFLLQCFYFVEQGLIGGGLLVTGSICEIELVEQSLRAGYLAVLDSTQVERFQAAFGFGDEEQVLETAVVAEGHGPVRGVVAATSAALSRSLAKSLSILPSGNTQSCTHLDA